MGWGDTLVNAWSAATNSAKTVAQSTANTAQSAYIWGKQEGSQATDYVKVKGAQAYDAGMYYATQAYDGVRNQVGNVYQAGKSSAAAAAEEGERAAIEARYLQALGPSAAAKRIYQKAKAAMGSGTAGSPIIACPMVLSKCAKLKGAKDLAILADNTYVEDGGNNSRLEQTGFQRLDPQRDREEFRKLGINDPEEMLEPGDSDFRARIYKRALPGGKTEYVVGYRGTQTGQDWQENLNQGSGQVDGMDPRSKSSYARAIRLANKVSAAAEDNGDSVSFTGHSLGGGMASAASAVTGHPAITFNAAGLNAHTIGEEYPSPPAPVDAYFTPTDPLSALQDNRSVVLGGIKRVASAAPYVGPVVGGALGAWIAKNDIAGTPVMPKAYGERHVLPFPPSENPPEMSLDGVKQAHGMDLVIKGIDAQRKEIGCP